MPHLFNVGSLVYLRADLSRGGAVLELLAPVGKIPRYRVFHSPTDIRAYDEDQLALATSTATPESTAETVVPGRWLDAGEFRARLTAARLAHPLTDQIDARHAARIKFIPFQFKPLLRFLRADRPRLLLADEVGVGKTIEAGLILKELQARQRVENVLIVCPKALVTNWRAEMRRFDEDFRPLDSASLGYCLGQMRLEGDWPTQYSRAIVHLELVRMDEHLRGDRKRRRPGLLGLDASPRFALTIVDAAHHVCNPGTSSHELIRYLCDESEAVLFLSATPVHLGSRNLFALLNLLRPDLFPTQAVFDEMVRPNCFINAAMRHVRYRSLAASWRADSAAALAEAAGTTWGRQALARDRDRLKPGLQLTGETGPGEELMSRSS